MVFLSNIELLELYELMVRSRKFEEAVTTLWEEGKIYGEMHLGVGEEATIAGIVSHLIPGDAIATDHRSSPPFIMRGVSPTEILLEFLGHSEGLCGGIGGHMHLFSKENSMMSSGIVGASGPAAVGFALASKYMNMKKNIAVALFGEGAMNQGMLLESFNLASSMNLPVLFVCKDNGLAITTPSSEVTGGKLVERMHGFGVDGVEVNGLDVEEVWSQCKDIIRSMRKKHNPFFVHAHVVHSSGHFLGDALLRSEPTPVSPLLKAAVSRKGARIDKRITGLSSVLSVISKARSQRKETKDPLNIIQKRLEDQKEKCIEIKNVVQKEIDKIVETSMKILKEEVMS